jgi:shikimate dehydrogenase
MITSDTLVFGSFSKKAGNVGCVFFNSEFEKLKINAIYKSFSVDDIYSAVQAAKTLGFAGFAVSMPFKTEVVKWLDYADDIVKRTGACNTVVLRNGELHGYNTDYVAISRYLSGKNKKIYILGNGGYSKTLQEYCRTEGLEHVVVTRADWKIIETIRNGLVFNCTPMEDVKVDPSVEFVDCITKTPTGKVLAIYQASAQFTLYTGFQSSSADL